MTRPGRTKRPPGRVAALLLTLLVAMLVLGPAAHAHHAQPDRTPCHACVHGKSPAPSLEPAGPIRLPQPTRVAVAGRTDDPAPAAPRTGRSTRAPPSD